ncbi:membrane-spanning 4-domains subfamily A member 4A-like isoform X1 [Acipenser oxyrinchus oxyrinchus]|uniref:Membrane-spanning 4-domains subfamily A member 4A-like isoform X1 n=1 Tax=Acipenser oxyrinchus oxyrinchus TaxID=40147 RepID=A0AAD8CMK5_ACIOX|nr:membrane-spanning 4-domains subfamily A member 4A-like isoform X1 [Acipenser oxyrinchus oxyrinchus]
MQHIYTGLQAPSQDIYSGTSSGVNQPGRRTDQASAMASHVTTAGGFAIVTHAYPLSSAGQAAPGTVASQLPGPMQTFLRGQPKALGVVQIIIGIVSLLFGPVLVNAYTFAGIIGLPFWTGVWYIISGSLAVAAENTHRRDLVKACLGMNVVSSIFAGVGFILYSINLSILPLYINDFNRSSSYYYPHSYSTIPYVGIVAVLLVLNILEICIAIATSAFGCKSECCYIAMRVVAFQQA